MGRRKRRNFGELIVPIVVLGALWNFTHPGDASVLIRWAVTITCLVTVVGILVAVIRHKQAVTAIFNAGSRFKPNAPTHARVAKPRRQGASDSIEKRLRDFSAAPQNSIASTPTEWTLQLIELLEWKRFEELCAACFEAKGHKVKITGLGADGGVDFYIYGKSGDLTRPLGVVQCKAWSSSRIGVKSIRELLGSMADVGCALGVFITTTSYTPEAEKFVAGKKIQLLDTRRMLDLIKSLPEEKQAELLALATAGDYQTPSCPSCGTKLLVRTAARGRNLGRRFWGCRNYPGCRYTMQGA